MNLKSIFIGFFLSFAMFSTFSQIVTQEVQVEQTPGANTIIKSNGNEKFQVNNAGVTVTGNETVTGDVRVGHSIHQYVRYVTLPSGGTSSQRFSMGYFSAGFTLEVTLTSNTGPLAATMFSKKVALNYYQYANAEYKKNSAVIYNLGSEASPMTVNIVPVGSGDQFDVTVYNGNGDTANLTIRMDFTTRGGVALSYVGAY